MQNKKVTMLAAVLAVTIIAMAGVGYAITYTATTTNTGNTMGNTYIELSQTGDAKYAGDFLTKLYFDTKNTDVDTTTFTPVYTHIAAAKGGEYTIGTKQTNTAALVSNPLGLTITPNNTGAQSVTMDVTVDNFHPENKGLKYTMVLTDSYTKDQPFDVVDTADYNLETKMWSFSTIDLNTDPVNYIVLLFVSANSTPSGETGFAALDEDDEEAQNTFTFTVTANTGA